MVLILVTCVFLVISGLSLSCLSGILTSLLRMAVLCVGVDFCLEYSCLSMIVSFPGCSVSYS